MFPSFRRGFALTFTPCCAMSLKTGAATRSSLTSHLALPPKPLLARPGLLKACESDTPSAHRFYTRCGCVSLGRVRSDDATQPMSHMRKSFSFLPRNPSKTPQVELKSIAFSLCLREEENEGGGFSIVTVLGDQLRHGCFEV